MHTAAHLILACTCALALAACATTVRVDEDLADYGSEVESLEGGLLADPQDVPALRRLGMIYTRTGHPEEGRRRLKRAFDLGDRNPRTLLYLGLANELLGDVSSAAALYAGWADMPSRSPYRALMRGRHAWVSRLLAREVIRQRASEEAEIAAEAAPADVVAVFPLAYQGDDRRYEPLGRGMAEMLSIDLAHVSGLRLVERVRLQALRDELALASTDYVDPSTAPRMGQLLAAGRVVSGSYDVWADERLQLDAAVVDAGTSDVSDLQTQSDAVDAFFRIEKRLVFALIDDLGIELTQVERTRIEDVPTQNLQAFLAWCRGLLAEDEQNFRAAAEAFREAVALDPGFELAAEDLADASGSAASSGPIDAFLPAVAGLDPSLLPLIDLVGHRSQMLTRSVTTLFFPGPDARKPAAESGGSAAVDAGLPDPPRPPGGNRP